MKREVKTTNWRERASTLQPRTEAFIDGKYQPAASGETFVCINPATGKSIAQVAACGSRDVEVAVASARRAFDDGHWSRMAPASRKKVLLRFSGVHGCRRHVTDA